MADYPYKQVDNLLNEWRARYDRRALQKLTALLRENPLPKQFRTIKNKVLYRGLNDDYAGSKLRRLLLNKPVVYVPRKTAEAWTPKKDVAFNFQGTQGFVLQAPIPASAVLMNVEVYAKHRRKSGAYQWEGNLFTEHEVIVDGSRLKPIPMTMNNVLVDDKIKKKVLDAIAVELEDIAAEKKAAKEERAREIAWRRKEAEWNKAAIKSRPNPRLHGVPVEWASRKVVSSAIRRYREVELSMGQSFYVNGSTVYISYISSVPSDIEKLRKSFRKMKPKKVVLANDRADLLAPKLDKD